LVRAGVEKIKRNLSRSVEKRIKKVPIEAKDCPGFLVNRIFMRYAGEVMLAAQEGAASPTEIEEAVKKVGLPMEPLILNDIVGNSA